MRRLRTFETGDTMYHLSIGHAHKNVLTAGDPDRIEKIAHYFDKVHEDVDKDPFHALNGHYFNRGLRTIHGTYKGMPVTAFSTGMGPASVSITMPEIIEACDHNDMNFIRIGTTGALRKDYNIGDLVVSRNAEVAESTSDKILGIYPKHLFSVGGYTVTLLKGNRMKGYVPEWAYATHEVKDTLYMTAVGLKKNHQEVHLGQTRVTDDIYFDAEETKKGKHHPNTVAVSMEFSAICALREKYNTIQNRNIKVGNILLVSDNVVRDADFMEMEDFLKNKEDLEDIHIKIGLDSLYKIRNQMA